MAEQGPKKTLSHISKHGYGDDRRAVAVVEHFSDGSESEPMVYNLGDPDEMDALRDHESAANRGESVTIEIEPETPLSSEDIPYREYKARREAGQS